MRASMLDTIHAGLRAHGAREGPARAAWSCSSTHCRNALLPGHHEHPLSLPLLFSGAVVTEQVFSWPGMGQLFFQALSVYDYPLLMGIMFRERLHHQSLRQPCWPTSAYGVRGSEDLRYG